MHMSYQNLSIIKLCIWHKCNLHSCCGSTICQSKCIKCLELPNFVAIPVTFFCGRTPAPLSSFQYTFNTEHSSSLKSMLYLMATVHNTPTLRYYAAVTFSWLFTFLEKRFCDTHFSAPSYATAISCNFGYMITDKRKDTQYMSRCMRKPTTWTDVIICSINVLNWQKKILTCCIFMVHVYFRGL